MIRAYDFTVTHGRAAVQRIERRIVAAGLVQALQTDCALCRT